MASSQKYSYANDPIWADIEPLPQDDGGPDALAQIAYTQEYSEAMSYMRAVMAANEFSERTLKLTEHCIGLNPAHYTVWLYRAKTLDVLSYPLTTELLWLNTVSLRHIKNYQIWHHRQHIITRLDSPAGEADFIVQMLEKDAKNYHVWSYRQWLVKRFKLWDDEGEMQDVERWLRRDVRNNSAWNHRWFLVFGRFGGNAVEGNGKHRAGVGEVKEEVWEGEMEFAKDAVRLAPQNESAWNYLRGLVKKRRRGIAELKEFAEEFAGVQEAQGEGEGEVDGDSGGLEKTTVRSSHALDVLADAYAEEEKNGKRECGDAAKALMLLAEAYDPLRAKYWDWRRSQLQQGTSVAAA